MTRHIASGVLLCLALAGCSPKVGFVALDGTWPTQPRRYRDATEEWTRRGILRRDYQEIFSADVLYKSPSWRAADVAHRASIRSSSAADRAELEAAARAADAEALEFKVLATTWDRRENELDRGARAVWSFLLIDDNGNQVAATKVVRDRRPRHVIRDEHPSFGDFAQAYTVTFPKTANFAGPDVRRLRLRIVGSRGAVELVWQSRP